MNNRHLWISLVILAVLILAPAGWGKEILVTSGDTLFIRVEDEPDLTKAYVVNDEGKITLPEAGDIKVAGQTLAQVREILTKTLGEYIREPRITVEMPGNSGREMLVYGEVLRPGQVKIKEDSRLMDVLNLVGKLTENADTAKAVLYRKDSTTPVSIDLEALLKGDLSRNIPVQEGDTLFIPARTQGTIVIAGQVRNPGERTLKIGMNVMEAIIAAGGFTAEADQKQVRITRKDQQPIIANLQEEPTDTGIPAWQTITLQAGDNIWVPENKEAYFNVLGGVRNPGQYPLKKKMTITDAITVAGGFADRAKKDQVKLARAPIPGSKSETMNINMTKLFSGDITQNVDIKPGDTISVDVASEKRSWQDVIFRDVLPVVSMIVYWGALR